MSESSSVPHLTVDIEKAKAIAELAKSTQPSTANSVPGDSVANHDPKALARFRQALEGMDDKAADDLVALIWIGRGDFKVADWDKAKAAAKDIGSAKLAGYIEGIPLVSDYLLQGLYQVGAPPKT